MKVFLHYEDNPDVELWKSLKITLPKSWKTGPTSKLLGQFVESYNNAFGENNPLVSENMHLSIKTLDGETKILKDLASDATVIDVIPDRADVYIVHGPSMTLADYEKLERLAKEREQEELKNTVQCTHFGCKKRFPKGGPYPECHFHKSPPVFHETAKFWSCCPHKKAYDWEDFQAIPGCQTGICSDVKEEQKLFLGGTDLREAAGESVKLKSIDDFNQAQAAGGSEAAPVLDRLRRVFEEIGIEKELFDQVIEGIKNELIGQTSSPSDTAVLEHTKAELGAKLKAAMKSIAAEQLRLK